MSVTASSGSPRVSPQLYDTLPLSSVRQAEQQDRFPDRGELDNLINFFQSGQSRVQASRVGVDDGASKKRSTFANTNSPSSITGVSTLPSSTINLAAFV